MAVSGYTGISYPFRVTNRGGCAISTTSKTDPTHIQESIQQIINTHFLERPMEGGWVYSQVLTLLFEPNDESLQQVIRSYIIDDLERLEERIECEDDDVEFVVEVDDNGAEVLFVNITYKIIKYNTYYTSKIKVGEVTHE